ncbi:armadillo repeat protein [Paramyrothecium foliicola]|nr:armadillo repeat protein [Paramyrothecium foliicola]
MARPLSSPILAQLRSAKTYPEQSAALQALKNEIVGHIQKKEAWIGMGVLEPIASALSSSNRSPGKINGKDARFHLVSRPLSDEDAIKLQALQLVGSFANGGASFLQPLNAARILPSVLDHISPYTNPPQIVVAALKALMDIVEASSLAGSASPMTLESIADSVFAPQHLDALNAMLSISSSKYLLQSQVNLTASLICKLCREDRHQQILTAAGALDCLAARLASFAVADGVVPPGADVFAQQEGLYELFPDAATSTSKLGLILDAIGTIVGDSRYRACRLIFSPVILAVFPSDTHGLTKALELQTPETDKQGNPTNDTQDMPAMDYFLPAVPIVTRGSPMSPLPFPTMERSESHSSNRHGLHPGSHYPKWTNARPIGEYIREREIGDSECPLLPWLILLVRTRTGYDRLMAAYLLTALFKAGLGSKVARETSIGLLVVPILVDMIFRNDKDEHDADDAQSAVKRSVLERAPAILAWLITDREYLQKAAFDCDAVRVLSKLLKRAYEPVLTPAQARFWSPEPDTRMDAESSSPLAHLGEPGIDSLLSHKIKVRESALKAIGALASGKEDYRKAIVTDDFVSYVVESLNEFPRKPKPPKDRPKDQDAEPIRTTVTTGYGKNPVSIIIAGCYVVRMLARSVSTLRTALVDYGVAMPILRFMKHPDLRVQIAATETMSNLVVDVSPVREPLTENGVMQVLCQHAHSDNPALRLNAMWALKHFVDAVGYDLKKSCLEQLGPGWLVQLVCDDIQDTALYNARSAGSATDDLDEDMEPYTSDETPRWLCGVNGSLHELDGSQFSQLRQAEDKLAAVREAELNPVRRARNEDVAIQEQGLNFIQNLIGKPMPGAASESPTETAELIDHLFNELGQDRLFEILASKLKTKVLRPFSRRNGRETRLVHPHPKLVVAAIYVLVHIAASVPRHRQLIIAQTELLRLLAQQASSKDREVRVVLCHLIINLTWPDEDESESQALAQRALELKKLGFHTKMETLKHQDRDLDVRERAKTAFWQMEKVTC